LAKNISLSIGINFVILFRKINSTMKKIFLGIALATMLFSCKEETKEKVKEASEAVGADLKQAADSAKVKAKKAIDSSKVGEKAKHIIAKGAEKVEEGAKKVKESVEK
jgi:vacuolar-type H+-ATPase subunit H